MGAGSSLGADLPGPAAGVARRRPGPAEQLPGPARGLRPAQRPPGPAGWVRPARRLSGPLWWLRPAGRVWPARRLPGPPWWLRPARRLPRPRPRRRRVQPPRAVAGPATAGVAGGTRVLVDTDVGQGDRCPGLLHRQPGHPVRGHHPGHRRLRPGPGRPARHRPVGRAAERQRPVRGGHHHVRPGLHRPGCPHRRRDRGRQRPRPAPPITTTAWRHCSTERPSGGGE